MLARYFSIIGMLMLATLGTFAQQGGDAAIALVRNRVNASGFQEADLADLVVKDHYTSVDLGITHTYLRQRHQGIEIWNAEIAVHQRADGSVVAIHNGAYASLAERVNASAPVVSGEAALATVLSATLPGTAVPPVVSTSVYFVRIGQGTEGLVERVVVTE